MNKDCLCTNWGDEASSWKTPCPPISTFSQSSIIIFYSVFYLFNPLLALPVSLSVSVYPSLARPLFHGSSSAGHWCAMSFLKGPRSSEPPPLSPLSLSLCPPPPPMPVTPLPSLPPSLRSQQRVRLTASPKSESWNRWNMNGSVVYEKGVWVERGAGEGPSIVS